MTDIVSAEKRSQMMAGIRCKNTRPEIAIRKALHAKGLRYKVHAKELPGKPDLVFPKYRAVIFVHGCFWHGHNCPLFKMPSTRTDFWENKILRNRQNDDSAIHKLRQAGWRVGIVWECAIKGKAKHNFNSVIESCVAWLASNDPLFEIRSFT